MIRIVIPMAGLGSRFVKAGYTLPKPLIEIYGRPMIEYVVKNLTPAAPHRFIFICQKEHLEKYGLRERLEALAPGCAVIAIDYLTRGTACTVLLAKEFINNADPLIIANSDQYVDADVDAFIAEAQKTDGALMTLRSQNPACSYVRLDENGFVTEVREKQVISDVANVGVFAFSHGADYVAGAEEMIARNETFNNEFYVAPVYNVLIRSGKRYTCFHVGAYGDGVYNLGTPEDLKTFTEDPFSAEIRRRID